MVWPSSIPRPANGNRFANACCDKCGMRNARLSPIIPHSEFRIPLPMSLKIHINGKLYPKEDAKISVYDHGLLYGDGVFEGMRSYGGKVFRLAEHLERLWNSAKTIWLEIPISREAMAKAVNDTLAANAI